MDHALMLFDQNFKSAVVARQTSDYQVPVVIHRGHAAPIFNQLDKARREILCTILADPPRPRSSERGIPTTTRTTGTTTRTRRRTRTRTRRRVMRKLTSF